ncbi:CDGSH iron-sulfur domain-containing protein [Alphaproteobacteria bacterium]|jgi:CDGSH-type Zn-finger protein|nr:CDGSH iron-sulfur domain-containing protein [Alphaproteobacteria bacterium]
MTNTIKINPNGPLSAKGTLTISVAGSSEEKSSAYLCRCGASENKPYCDGAHNTCGFEDVGGLGEHQLTSGENTGTEGLEINVKKNGPLVVGGPMTLTGGEEVCQSERLFLCRCGASKNRPYCDGSHKAVGFEAD